MFTETIYLFSHTQHSEWCAPCTTMIWLFRIELEKKNTNKPKGNYSCSYIHFFVQPLLFEKKSVVVYSVYRFFFLAGLWKFRMNRLLHIFRTICRPIKMIGIYWCWHQHFKSQVFPYNRLIITAFATIVVWFCDCGLLSHWYRVSYPKTIAPTNTQR